VGPGIISQLPEPRILLRLERRPRVRKGHGVVFAEIVLCFLLVPLAELDLDVLRRRLSVAYVLLY